MTTTSPSPDRTHCPCLSGLTYPTCCAPLHLGVAVAQTAEQLMRSRYSAFAVGDSAYLLSTWHETTRPGDLVLDDQIRWYRLDIITTSAGTPFDTVGTVEFEAFRKSSTGNGSQREVSQFVREGGQWFYVDGRSVT